MRSRAACVALPLRCAIACPTIPGAWYIICSRNCLRPDLDSPEFIYLGTNLSARYLNRMLARLEGIPSDLPIPPSAAGERAYLRGRTAYDNGDFSAAEGDLATISKKSRM